MARSSMPLVGITGAKSEEDEKLLDIYRMKGKPHSDDKHTFYIIDARPKLNSTVTRVKGGGQVFKSRYKHTVMINGNIENIHRVRESYLALASLCEPGAVEEDGRWLEKLNLTLWLT